MMGHQVIIMITIIIMITMIIMITITIMIMTEIIIITWAIRRLSSFIFTSASSSP